MIESLKAYGPTQPFPVLVVELNKFYHEHEAARYETTHPEIFEQLPALWNEMLDAFDRLESERTRSSEAKSRKLRILNIGCGTGFEAEQCLRHFGSDRVERLVCVDPSERMLGQCRRALLPWGKVIQYMTSSSDLDKTGPGFHLLITNAVLHHMPDPIHAIRELAPFLSSDAMWLSGHEPSRRFYHNPDCKSLLLSYNAYNRWKRLSSPRKYLRKILRLTGIEEFPSDYAARRAFEAALFERRPPASLVSRVVDYHVVIADDEGDDTRGFDFTKLESAFVGDWELLQHKTYSFLGPWYEGRLPAYWQAAARGLSEKHPDDGASSCLVWRRAHGSRVPQS
jgi:SAM-dependent methyltransferase